MLLVKTRLMPSNVHGLGCFAAERVVAGQVVWSLAPSFDKVWSHSEYEALPSVVLHNICDHVYLCKRTGLWVYCVDDARFMNHSSAPNVLSSGMRDVAARDIEPGDEILCDYESFVVGGLA